MTVFDFIVMFVNFFRDCLINFVNLLVRVFWVFFLVFTKAIHVLIYLYDLFYRQNKNVKKTRDVRT